MCGAMGQDLEMSREKKNQEGTQLVKKRGDTTGGRLTNSLENSNLR